MDSISGLVEMLSGVPSQTLPNPCRKTVGLDESLLDVKGFIIKTHGGYSSTYTQGGFSCHSVSPQRLYCDRASRLIPTPVKTR